MDKKYEPTPLNFHWDRLGDGRCPRDECGKPLKLVFTKDSEKGEDQYRCRGCSFRISRSKLFMYSMKFRPVKNSLL